MRRACGPLLLVTLITMLSTALRAEAGAAQTAMPRVVAPPTLDGRLDDWAPAPQVAMADSDAWQPASPQFAEYQGPSDLSAEVRLAWDNQCLYVAIESRDDTLVRAQSAADMFRDGSYHGDSIVLAVAGDGAADGSAIVVSLLQAASLVWRAEPAARAGELRTVGRAIWARADEGGGQRVTYEISIPWSELDGVKPIAGERIIFSASAFDDDGAGMKGCLERTASVELSASTTVLAPPTPGPAARQGRTATFPAPDVIRFDKKRFIVNGADTLLFGGAVDYTTLPRQTWASTLKLAQAAGMNTVSVTVPWSHHQPVREKLDLTDLRDFLAAVSAAGLQAQVNIGPFAGEWWEAGGVPGWFFALPASERPKAAANWVNAVLSLVKDQQLTAGGPVVAVLVRPLPGTGGRTDAASLTNLSKAARDAGAKVPVLTANAPPARDNSHFALANLLDSVSFYTPPSFADVARVVSSLAEEENGPAVASELLGSYDAPEAARRSADTVKVALANGATAVTVASFAGGANPRRLLAGGAAAPGRVVEAGGLPTPGYGEVRLVGRFIDLFGPQLARAAVADDQVRADDREVRVATRLAEKTGFVFLWNEDGVARQVRLSYHPPGTATVVTIPEAGAVALAGQSAKIIVLDAPVGHGVLRYATSEIADLRQVGARTILAVYGDRDAAGEIALRWPGPPLVTGQVARQRWDEKSSTLFLDYFHTADDQCVLVDDLQILILARERAAALTDVGDGEAAVVSAGRHVMSGTLAGDGLKASLLTPPGETKVTAVVPADVTAVLVDGTPVPFTSTAPTRLLSFSVATESWPPQAPPKPIWARLIRGSERATSPQVHTDAIQFRPEAEAPPPAWRAANHLDRAPEALGLAAGRFAALRTRLELDGRTMLSLAGVKDPTTVLVNGKLVEFTDPAAEDREADLLPYLLPGENTIEILVQLRPREFGVIGLRGPATQFPTVTLRGLSDEITLEAWETAAGLNGEAAGWAALALPADGWGKVRLGPWREQGRRYADVAGVGWYRVPFTLPQMDGWEMPYQLQVKLTGNGELYLNGKPLATVPGSGTYRVPLPASSLIADGDNVLAVAICGDSPKAGLEAVTIIPDPTRMLRPRQIEIRF